MLPRLIKGAIAILACSVSQNVGELNDLTNAS